MCLVAAYSFKEQQQHIIEVLLRARSSAYKEREKQGRRRGEEIIKHMLHIACKVVLNLIKSGNRMVINFSISTRGFVKV